MTRIDRTPMPRAASPAQDRGGRGAGAAGPGRRLLGALVLALATGLPLRSAGHLLPEGEGSGPFLGV